MTLLDRILQDWRTRLECERDDHRAELVRIEQELRQVDAAEEAAPEQP